MLLSIERSSMNSMTVSWVEDRVTYLQRGESIRRRLGGKARSDSSTSSRGRWPLSGATGAQPSCSGRRAPPGEVSVNIGVSVWRQVAFSAILGTDVVPSLPVHLRVCASATATQSTLAMFTRLALRTASSASRSSVKSTRLFHSTLRRDEIFKKANAEVCIQSSPPGCHRLTIHHCVAAPTSVYDTHSGAPRLSRRPLPTKITLFSLTSMQSALASFARTTPAFT